ncbi:NADH-ubiquinone dehydrogenase [Mesorhizobium sp.]|uniref:NADH-ubiquinone dehydrogenase n=1 Tax=Mesorhizobium sp. TaxID=1871066 RepID=UPI000FE9EFAD|nr:NADH-ubiquinone dehydrogenase [Mesorhizobium sp.]RWM29924.1 MAG: NADH-ubiquinone dehydrogenase [Mesorhizobium sp.]RWM40426.1 MAG: NADH-ubiquinone dehydrogenase [Mesorhizobium sp.]TIO77978.1 MAG: NADH-ubiquinone dehydrogenase [Mesorhizobium sp.]TIO86706.1 MAG: NADH-ubiquinone dehydrogenase [Mesorhizobium sp.]TJV52150.1 MAG: NADH-ubiquinone dehydrogenase [Mesorhizobium sp.]
MAPYSIAYPLMPYLDQLEKMNQDLTKMMPSEMASAVNLMAHPVAGAAAMSALGIGLANHALGIWMGAVSGAVEASQRMFQPFLDDLEARTEAANNSSKARKAAETLIAEAQTFARDVTDIAANATEKALDATGADTVAETAATGLMPEDFRQPKAIDKPAKPSDLKAISGIGPKLEKVLNGLGIWTYGQIAAWTSEEIAWVEDYLSLAGRIGRDDWAAQAAALAAKN